MKLLIFLSLIFFLALPVISQENETEKVESKGKLGKNGLGLAVGATSAYGISYRRYFNRFAIQPTFAPFKNENQQQFHAGLSFLYNLVEGEKTNFFVYQSNYFYYNKDLQDYFVYDPNHANYGYYEEGKVTSYFNNGLGLGFEFLILKVVSLNLMGGYGAYQDFERIGFAGEAGLYYRF